MLSSSLHPGRLNGEPARLRSSVDAGGAHSRRIPVFVFSQLEETSVEPVLPVRHALNVIVLFTPSQGTHTFRPGRREAASLPVLVWITCLSRKHCYCPLGLLWLIGRLIQTCRVSPFHRSKREHCPRWQMKKKNTEYPVENVKHSSNCQSSVIFWQKLNPRHLGHPDDVSTGARALQTVPGEPARSPPASSGPARAKAPRAGGPPRSLRSPGSPRPWTCPRVPASKWFFLNLTLRRIHRKLAT